MIELRWIKRSEPMYCLSGEQTWIDEKKVLQYRQLHEFREAETEWSDWQDVPTSEEEKV